MLQRQVALGGQGASGEAAGPAPRASSAGRPPCPTTPPRTDAAERSTSSAEQRRLVLDRVGDPTQQIGARDRSAQRWRQLRDRQRKGARHVRQNPILIDLIGNVGIVLQGVLRHRTGNTSSSIILGHQWLITVPRRWLQTTTSASTLRQFSVCLTMIVRVRLGCTAGTPAAPMANRLRLYCGG